VVLLRSHSPNGTQTLILGRTPHNPHKPHAHVVTHGHHTVSCFTTNSIIIDKNDKTNVKMKKRKEKIKKAKKNIAHNITQLQTK
jgi:hypothetical protein